MNRRIKSEMLLCALAAMLFTAIEKEASQKHNTDMYPESFSFPSSIIFAVAN